MQAIDFIKAYEPLDRKLYAFALKLTKNDFDAQDLLQEAYTRAFQHKDSFKEGTNFKSWISTIVRNTFINDYRRKRVMNLAEESVEYYDYNLKDKAVTNLCESSLMMQELNTLLTSLDEKHHIPFRMCYQGYNYQEIADAMNIPIGTIKSRIHTARKQLKTKIQEHYAS